MALQGTSADRNFWGRQLTVMALQGTSADGNFYGVCANGKSMMHLKHSRRLMRANLTSDWVSGVGDECLGW